MGANWKVCPSCLRLIALSEIDLKFVPDLSLQRRPSLVQKLRNHFTAPRAPKIESPPVKFAGGCDILDIQRELDGFPQLQKTERKLRLLAWQRLNHGDAPHELPTAWARENMCKVLPLMKGKRTSMRITRMELLRQLGRFDEALAAVEECLVKCSDEEQFVVLQLMQACLQKRTDVFELEKVSSE